jgi:FkbM family methyltransferase
VKSILGVVRSAMIYHRRDHVARMTRFYRPLVRSGDLVFDIGAHVGDRTRAFLRLGCRVVAVEPQPALSTLLKLMHLGNRHVKVVAAALSDGAASVKLAVNTKNPTVSTASADFIQAAKAGAPGWEGQIWDRELQVRATTLDALIARHGMPAFVKIDVEGFEDRVLAGLSHAVPALSFEFTTHQKHVAFRTLERLRSLGAYRFNVCLGESWREVFDGPRKENEIADWLTTLPAEANSGDIYCFRM